MLFWVDSVQRKWVWFSLPHIEFKIHSITVKNRRENSRKNCFFSPQSLSDFSVHFFLPEIGFFSSYKSFPDIEFNHCEKSSRKVAFFVPSRFQIFLCTFFYQKSVFLLIKIFPGHRIQNAYNHCENRLENSREKSLFLSPVAFRFFCALFSTQNWLYD